MQRFLQDKATLQEKRKKSIDVEVQELKNRKNEARAQSLELDRYFLQLDKMKADEESQMKMEKKKYEEVEGQNNLLLKELRNNRNIVEKQREQKEFNDLMKRNYHKEIQKEANYKNVTISLIVIIFRSFGKTLQRTNLTCIKCIKTSILSLKCRNCKVWMKKF